MSVSVEPTVPVRKRWTGALGAASLGLYLATLTPTQVLLPAQVQGIDPVGKVSSLALVSATASVVAIVTNPVAGALSDRSRSRFGRRRPFVFAGAVCCALSLAALSGQHTVVGAMLCWMAVQACINVMDGALSAAIPDQVPVTQRASVSALYALAAPVAVVVGVALVTVVVTGQVSGYLLLAGLVVALALPYVLDRSDRPVPADAPRPPRLGAAGWLRAFFVTPWRERDFRWAFAGRMAIQLANALGTLYLLYFLTDVIKHPNPRQAIFPLTLLYTGAVVVTSLTGGWLSDRVGRRKPFVAVSSCVVASALALMAFAPAWSTMLVAAPLLGAGMGVFLAVDYALITQVLPSADDRGKDLGVLNLASTAPQALAPVVASAVIAATDSYTWLYALAGGVALAGALLVRPIRGVR